MYSANIFYPKWLPDFLIILPVKYLPDMAVVALLELRYNPILAAFPRNAYGVFPKNWKTHSRNKTKRKQCSLNRGYILNTEQSFSTTHDNSWRNYVSWVMAADSTAYVDMVLVQFFDACLYYHNKNTTQNHSKPTYYEQYQNPTNHGRCLMKTKSWCVHLIARWVVCQMFPFALRGFWMMARKNVRATGCNFAHGRTKQ